MGWRLNRRLKALRDSHEGFAVAVRELNAAAARAEQGLADLRAATDEAIDMLADRIEKGRALAAKLERLIDATRRAATSSARPTPAPTSVAPASAGWAPCWPPPARRARRAASGRASAETAAAGRRAPPPVRLEDDLFDDAAARP